MHCTSVSPSLFSPDVEHCCCVAWCSGCWRGILLWKQQWRSLCGGERSAPGTKRGTELTRAFSCPARLSNLPSLQILLFTPPPSQTPHSSFTFSLLFFRFLLSISPTLCLFRSPLNFILSFPPTKNAIQPWHLKANKTASENVKPAQKCHRSRDFCLKIRSLARVALCLLFTEGSVFSIGPVWERVRWRSGGELLAWYPVGKNREWRWRA